MDNGRMNIFTFRSDSLEEFREKAEKAKVSGATHITLSQIEKSRWQWDRDPEDPYPNWSMLVASLFKIVVPAELKEWLPEDFAKRNYELIAARGRILKELGLKGSFHMKEPCYLPEGVYAAHPEWRGPRCDHPRRARNTYYSPCVDRPEVLGMYRRAMTELCKAAEIEYFHIFTNDSGGGLCWSSGLYPGRNGPEWCRHIPQSERVAGFLDTLRLGAADAGKDIWIEINSNIGIKEPEHAMDAMWPSLPDHIAVNKKSNDGKPLASEVFLNWEYTLQPVKNIVRPFEFLEQYENSEYSGRPAAINTIDDTDFNEYHFLMDRFNKCGHRGLAARTALIRTLAKHLAGHSGADELTQAWCETERGILHFLDTGLEGLVSCSVNQRWLNRPFVLFPDELAPDEKEYYRKYQFQANDEKHADDLLDIQNSSFIRGYSGVFLAVSALDKAISLFDSAAGRVRTVSENAPAGRSGMLLYADRLELLSCFMKNAKNAIRFQHIVDTADYEREPEISPEWPLDAEKNQLLFDEVTRAEIDNTYHIIRLIKGREETMLTMADTPEKEDIFLFSPELVRQLEKKARIMLDRMNDSKRLFITNNK